MARTVGELIRLPALEQLDVDTSSTLSEKKWTNDYRPLNPARIRNRLPTRQGLAEFLSSGTIPSVVDYLGLHTPAHPLNSQRLELMTEGDVTHDFDQNIIPFVELAFSGDRAFSIPVIGAQPVPGGPKLWPRSLVASKNSSSNKKIVDYQMTMSHQESSLEAAAMIGELKRPRIIKRKEWAFEINPSDTTLRLMQEARGYAHLYECPQVFLFDSKTLVLVQFRAKNIDEIAEESCWVDVCVIPREMSSHIPDQCSMAEGLRALALRGFTRLSATRGSTVSRSTGRPKMVPIPLVIDEYERHHKFYSGDTFWIDPHGQVYRDHPHGYLRDIIIRQRQRSNGEVESRGYWVWLDRQRNFVADDTKNCFIN